MRRQLQSLWVVRHGESAGNLARAAAESARDARIDHVSRDMDSPLSELGQQQADALARWFAARPAHERPNCIISSPYLRARQTAAAVGAALDLPVTLDERLREKEFGILDRLTTHGIRLHFPELAEQRAHVGKFYFRPPGGESWCDVILRLRSLLDNLQHPWPMDDAQQDSVLLVGHQVTVNCLRYLIEGLDEEQILTLDRAADIPNCALTLYRRDATDGRTLRAEMVNALAPLQSAGAPLTAEPDKPAQPGA